MEKNKYYAVLLVTGFALVKHWIGEEDYSRSEAQTNIMDITNPYYAPTFGDAIRIGRMKLGVSSVVKK